VYLPDQQNLKHLDHEIQKQSTASEEDETKVKETALV